MDQFEPLDIGDKVKHPKFGTGTVMQRFGETESQKVIVKFGAEFGEKKLVTKIANMKRISERPTLSAAPGAPGTFPGTFPGSAPAAGVGVAPVRVAPPTREVLDAGVANEDEEEPALEEEDDEEGDDEIFDEDEGETGEEEVEEE